MKTKKNHKNLFLNKRTVVNLNTNEMRKVLGGDILVIDPVAVVAISTTNPHICDEPTEDPNAIAAAPVGYDGAVGALYG